MLTYSFARAFAHLFHGHNFYIVCNAIVDKHLWCTASLWSLVVGRSAVACFFVFSLSFLFNFDSFWFSNRILQIKKNICCVFLRVLIRLFISRNNFAFDILNCK